ncbi:hypothetical protein F4678DRAFT_446969 [Xylaria arbuscula]|nr:hypothetical protein F4678DRAFT_446969 [Xylaria arbuscula]
MSQQLQTATFVVATLQLVVSICLFIARTYSLYRLGGSGQDHGQGPDEEEQKIAFERAVSARFPPTGLHSLFPGPIPAERLSSVVSQGDEEHQDISQAASQNSDAQPSSATHASAL